MKTHILKGSKQEIAERLVQLPGDVHEAIVFEEEPTPSTNAAPAESEDIFAEMEPFVVDGPPVDDSREAIYTREEGE